MLALIIYDHKKQADFAQKGLQYENLPCEMLNVQEFDQNQNFLQSCDGVILLLSTPEVVHEISSFIRRQGNELPIMLLPSSHDALYSELIQSKRVNFYHVRPFSFRVAANEMRYAIYSYKERINNSLLTLRGLELDIMAHTVTFRGKRIPLRNKEFALLHFMMTNCGKLLSRTTILENVWDRNAYFLTNTVDVHVSQLRRKIDSLTEDKFIHTIPCAGYIFA